jgi:hypothetical protein
VSREPTGDEDTACDQLEEDATYYQSVEDHFVSKRGAPLFLSSEDWLLVRQWRRLGVPLRVVLRGITDALDTHAHSWGRARKVAKLTYCAAEVDVATERWVRAMAPGAEAGIDVRSKLEGLAQALEQASGLGRKAAAAARRICKGLRERASRPATASLDGWLIEREQVLLRALEADLGPDELARLLGEIDSDLARYRGRMPERVLEQVHAEAVARRLLERHGLTRLSLFHDD